MADLVDKRFPEKIYHLLQNNVHESLSWSDCGTEVVIEKISFTKFFLKSFVYFKTSNFQSIVRQFNLYRFRKICATVGKKIDLIRYRNEKFHRDHPDLVHLVQRTSARSQRYSRSRRKVSDNIMSPMYCKYLLALSFMPFWPLTGREYVANIMAPS